MDVEMQQFEQTGGATAIYDQPVELELRNVMLLWNCWSCLPFFQGDVLC
jgi:hypothetical protein